MISQNFRILRNAVHLTGLLFLAFYYKTSLYKANDFSTYFEQPIQESSLTPIKARLQAQPGRIVSFFSLYHNSNFLQSQSIFQRIRQNDIAILFSAETIGDGMLFAGFCRIDHKKIIGVNPTFIILYHYRAHPAPLDFLNRNAFYLKKQASHRNIFGIQAHPLPVQ